MSPKYLSAFSALALTAALAACSDVNSPSADPGARPHFAIGGPTPGVVDTAEFEICKYGTSATFTYSVASGPAQSISLADGQCAVLANTRTLGKGTIQVTATETADPTIVLDSIVATTNSVLNPVGVRGAPITGTNTYAGMFNGDRGTLVEFYNSPAPPPPPPPLGCTYTHGYWKNHTSAWPTPYSSSATFYTSGQSWVTVLKTPVKGNAYYILAYQYIAAVLNGANGASAPDNVQQTMAASLAYFTNPTANPLTKSQLTTMGGLLDQYNNGLLGVPHCD